MTALVLGVDPGATGAYALLDADGSAGGLLIALEDLPTIADGKLRWVDASAMVPRLLELAGGRPMRAIVERQQAMPLQGRSSCVSIGIGLGSLLATLQAAGCAIEIVSANVWKKTSGLSSDKQKSLDRARLLYPTASLDRKKDHNRAEALLIAAWALRRST